MAISLECGDSFIRSSMKITIHDIISICDHLSESNHFECGVCIHICNCMLNTIQWISVPLPPTLIMIKSLILNKTTWKTKRTKSFIEHVNGSFSISILIIIFCSLSFRDSFVCFICYYHITVAGQTFLEIWNSIWMGWHDLICKSSFIFSKQI